MMKQVVAFLLGMLMLVGGLVPQNDLTELGKLPQLLEHYRYHRALAHGQLSPASFLALHYGPHGTDHRKHPYTSRDAQDHHRLPLDQHHHDCVMVSFVLPASRIVLPQQALPWPTADYRPEPGPLYAYCVSTSLLQPPRA